MPDTSALDADIALAWAAVQTCRQRWARSPNSDTIDAAAEAEDDLNRLLEYRFMAARNDMPMRTMT